MTDHVFAEGELVRVAGWRGVGRIVRFNLVAGEVDLWFGRDGRASMRTTTTDKLMPAQRGDVAPPLMPAFGSRR